MDDLEFSALHKNIQRLCKVKKKLLDSSEYKSFESLSDDRMSTRIVIINYRIFIQDRREFKTLSMNPSFWEKGSSTRRMFHHKIATHFFNYIASVSSKIDHMNVLFFPELESYSKENLSSLFYTKPEHSIFKKLRHFVVHYKYLDVGLRQGLSQDSKDYFDFTFTKADLLSYSKWTRAERNFIESQPEVFSFMDILSDFHNHFTSTIRTLRGRLIHDHKSDFIKLLPQMIDATDVAREARLSSALPFGPSHIRLLRLYISVS